MSYNFATIQGWKDYLETIPEDQFCTEDYHETPTTYCAVGHIRHGMALQHGKSEDMVDSGEIMPVMIGISNFLGETDSLFDVNDGVSEAYKQPTSKARVLACLSDVLEAGEQQ